LFHHKENRCIYCEIDERHFLGLQEFVKKSKTKKTTRSLANGKYKKRKGKNLMPRKETTQSCS